uniref:MRP-L46 domain-containing protein n=1 Tax=Steinernema glaseri TaxID=37863 RepID=A0A1I8AEL7_9BILA
MSVRRLFSTAAGRRVDIFGAVVLSRFPVVAPPMSDVERRYSEQVLQMEAENSLRSDFELRSIRDKKLIAKKEQLEAEGKDLSELEGELSVTAQMQEDEWKKKASEIRAKLIAKKEQLEAEGKDLSELEGELSVTAQMQEDEWKKKASEIRVKYGLDAPLESTADVHSLKRCLDRKLVLLVKQKLHHRDDDYRTPWIIPQRKNEGESLREQKLHHRDDDYRTPWIIPQRKNEGESLRETVEKCVGDLFEETPKISIMGNAPFASYRYRYPKKLKDVQKADEAEIFFFDAHIHGSKDPEFSKTTLSDFMWCTPEELQATLTTRGYKNRLKTALFE